MRTVFYSWQSDLANNKNRGFIGTCIDAAIKRCDKLNLDIIQDRDTLNIPGTPDICDTIFEKINNCSFFIADISLINHSSIAQKETPNPNVLIELGYAAKLLGWNKIICIFNTEYGDISDLPFDLRQRRILTYTSKDWEDPKIKKKTKERIIECIYSTITCEDSNTDNILFEGNIMNDCDIILAEKIDKYNEIIIFYQENGKEYQFTFKSKSFPQCFNNNKKSIYNYDKLDLEILDAYNINIRFNNEKINFAVTKIIGCRNL